ncbi:MAG: EscU/YscU/HrcU family type III secretion system export apparatus switch protein [Anaeromyxobacter sp.]|nr:EscU/YscU/HrcU family type III secretion system export apparatus switch protein [Anaeromyxobacter sp.]MBL0276173.1 EscU/YscU/HrcU family type III secretion system export apparatus switch protein [Anaeromyxobacter sp.]
MADEEADQEEKTEAPSGKRMGQAQERGDLPMGRDVAPVAGLLAATVAMVVLGPALRGSLSSLFSGVTATVDRTPFGDLPALMAQPIGLTLAVCAAAAAGAALATLAQTKGGFWSEKIEPDFTRLWQGVHLFKLFTKDFLVDLGIALVKVVAIGLAAWLASRADFLALPAMLGASPAEALGFMFGMLATAAKPVLLVVAAIAGIDVAVVHFRFMKKMKMTKEEAKREYKEDEGDPLARGKRKKRHREIVASAVRREVPRADALLVNPTHVAIALRYRKDEGRAPRVIAKGKGLLAEHMRALAREHGIPIVEDIPLARLLYRKVKTGREIPAATYKAVATILAFVYRVTGRSPGAGQAPARLAPGGAARA